MNLVRWEPFRELEEMTNRLNRFFARPRPFARTEDVEGALAFADWAPVVDIRETPEEFVVKAELPGMNKEEIKVAIENGVLYLRGERKLEKEEKGKKFHRIERAYGTFMRGFALPENVEEKKLLAVYKEGMLEVHLPKKVMPEPKAVEVKVT